MSTNRNLKDTTLYSKMTLEDAEKTLGLNFMMFEKKKTMTLDDIRSEALRLGKNIVEEMKETVYSRILEYLAVEGYPVESVGGFNEANVNDLVLYILASILYQFKCSTSRNVIIEREKEIISKDTQTGGNEEFVLVDLISVAGSEDTCVYNYVLVIECKRSVYGIGKQQCMLAMRDMQGHNGRGEVYGFVTTGEDWQMIKFDGSSFTQTDKFAALFRNMKHEGREEWLKNNSAVVDCMVVALLNGGVIMKKGVAAKD
ncbi:hypothetical protein BDZ91DRAFT_49160, partial [Kalaharituber pfeilii]